MTINTILDEFRQNANSPRDLAHIPHPGVSHSIIT